MTKFAANISVQGAYAYIGGTSSTGLRIGKNDIYKCSKWWGNHNTHVNTGQNINIGYHYGVMDLY
jgi:hypothetical protein